MKHKLLKPSVQKLTALFLSLLLTLSEPFFVMTARAQENTAFHIADTEDLLRLSEYCETDSWSLGKTIILDKDITLAGSEFTGRETCIPTFGGTFLGQGHTISGISLSGGSNSTGFFRYIQETGEVHDLTLSGNIKAESSHSLLSLFAGSNKGLISNCRTQLSLIGGDRAGGFAGCNEASGVITDCIAEGHLYGKHFVGGIAGDNRGSILNCHNLSFVNTTASDKERMNLSSLTIDNFFTVENNFLTTENAASVTDIGGIAGTNAGVIRACVNEGTVGYPHVGYNIGGIAGSQTGYIEGCMNYGALHGRKDVGGIAGQMEPSSILEFSEDTMQKLNTELNVLHELISQAITDTKGTSLRLTTQLEHLLTSVKGAQNAVDDILSQAGNDFGSFAGSTDFATLPTPKPISLDFLDRLPFPSASATPSESPSETPESSPSVTPTGTPESSPSVTPTGTPESSPSVTPTETSESSPSVTPTETPESSPSVTPTETPEGSSVTPTDTPVTQAGFNALFAEEGSYRPKPVYTQPTAITLCELSVDLPETNALPTLDPDAFPTLDPDAFPTIDPDMLPTLNPDRLPTLPPDFNFGREDIENDLNKLQQNIYEDASDALGDAQTAFRDYASVFHARLTAAQNSLSSSFSAITSDLSLLNTMLNEENQTLLDDFQAIFDEINLIGNLITSPETSDSDDIIMDISAEDTPADTTGKVVNCINNGSISSDINAGGIAGALSRENNLDPEDDFALDKNTSTTNFRYKERLVLRDCQNNGEVSAKKDYAGGIAGYMTMGSIIGCVGGGQISAEQDMTGGIAGYSSGSIYNSFAKCTLSGDSQIGGIAGNGKTIQNCRSMVNIKDGNTYLGSIAGKADDLSSIRGNYFVEGCLPGIDGINYSGFAESLPYEEFMSLENLPAIFNQIYLTFRTEESIVAVLTLNYGENFAENKLPSVPYKENCTGKWQTFDLESVTYDQTIYAEYEEYISTLESELTQNEKPLLLAEGQFSGDDRLVLSPIDAYPENSLNQGVCYRVTVDSNDSGPFTFRYLPPAEMENPQISILEDGAFLPLSETIDGSYLVFTSDLTSFTFCCSDNPKPPVSPTVIGLLCGVLLLSFIALFHGMKKKRKAKS